MSTAVGTCYARQTNSLPNRCRTAHSSLVIHSDCGCSFLQTARALPGSATWQALGQETNQRGGRAKHGRGIMHHLSRENGARVSSVGPRRGEILGGSKKRISAAAPRS